MPQGLCTKSRSRRQMTPAFDRHHQRHSNAAGSRMTGNELVVLDALVALASGLPALLFGKLSTAGQSASCALLVAANCMGLTGVCRNVAERAEPHIRVPSPIYGAELVFGIDGLAAFFLVPLLIVTVLAAVYALGYWSHAEHPKSGRRVTAFLGTLTGGMILLVAARDGLGFLLGWEIMALSAFFCVGAEDDEPATRRAAWLYLSLSHVATLCLFAMFAVSAEATGTYEWAPLPAASTRLGALILTLAIVGFGAKAGLMPLHIWLPSAHAQAPSHISAVMSGIVIKMGIYGLVRVTSLMPDIPAIWGAAVIALGVISALLGIANAIAQRDIKRIFAYSSIENVGVIAIGLGFAILGRATGKPTWVVLGLAGALLHVWNHALFKSLLFFTAGAVIHAAGTRNIEQLGGLAKRMPRTSICFLVGAAAICGLPPLNGFVSELLIYLGLFDAAHQPGIGKLGIVPLLAAPSLAMVGALAVACFVRAYGIAFLGAPRSAAAAMAHECGLAMGVPMMALAAGCVLIGTCPYLASPMLERAIDAWAGDSFKLIPIADLAPLKSLAWVSLGLLATVVVGTLALRARTKAATAPRGLTWDCGYAAPAARMQYTASSFGSTIAGLFRWALLPRQVVPALTELFPRSAVYRSRWADVVLERAVYPLARGVVRLFSWGRYLQQGSIHAYLLYILAMIVVLLVWK